MDSIKTPNFIKRDVKLPNNQNKLAFVLENVCTPEECQEYIRITEDRGYEVALLNIGGGKQTLATDMRNNSRCIWDSEEVAADIWERIKEFIPAEWKGRKVMGLNERLRFLKYVPGQYFKPHVDGCYRRDNGEESHITVQLYLNEGFKGGSTTFMSTITGEDSREDAVECVPKTGMILVFQHDILHEGSLLETGQKYAMRTDVMYTQPKRWRSNSC